MSEPTVEIKALDALRDYAQKHALRVALIIHPAQPYYFCTLTWHGGETAGRSNEGIGQAIAKAISDFEFMETKFQ
jgi:hypothetical protein